MCREELDKGGLGRASRLYHIAGHPDANDKRSTLGSPTFYSCHLLGMEVAFLALPAIVCAKPPCHFQPWASVELAVRAVFWPGPEGVGTGRVKTSHFVI